MIYYRKARREDCGGLIKVLSETWDIDNIIPEIFKMVVSDPNTVVFVALDDETERLVGTATFFWQYKLIRNGSIAGYIEEVAVAEEYTKHGIGKELVRLCTEEARRMGCYKVTLCCYEDLISFYVKCGFYKCNSTMRMDFNNE